MEWALSTSPVNSSPPLGIAKTLHSGLAGLDFPLGGIERGALVVVTGAPCTGKTFLLLELAARVMSRYRQNVVFLTAHEPAVYLARKAAQRGDANIAIGSESPFSELVDHYADGNPVIYLVESRAFDFAATFGFADRLRQSRTLGCALLIMDGFSSYAEPPATVEEIDGVRSFPAERWHHTPLLTDAALGTLCWATASGIPVVVGLTTPSLMEPVDPPEAGCTISAIADRSMVMHRPELYCETAKQTPEDRNVACLSGRSPQWWDTRCSRLRLRPRDFKFETVV